MIFLIIYFSTFVIAINILYLYDDFRCVQDYVGIVEKTNLIKIVKHITYELDH